MNENALPSRLFVSVSGWNIASHNFPHPFGNNPRCIGRSAFGAWEHGHIAITWMSNIAIDCLLFGTRDRFHFGALDKSYLTFTVSSTVGRNFAAKVCNSM
jgi:hypothetical protein